MDIWMPVLQGDVYCSPGCGFGCKKTQHDERLLEGYRLAGSLGAGWTVRVWDNLGWHVEVISPCRRISLHADRFQPTHYVAFLNAAGEQGGRWFGHGSTPEEAIREAVESGKRDRDAVVAILEGL